MENSPSIFFPAGIVACVHPRNSIDDNNVQIWREKISKSTLGSSKIMRV